MNDIFKPLPNNGKLMKNRNKTEDKHPDSKGEIFLSRELLEMLMQEPGDLIEVKLSAWVKVSQAGNKYLSIQASAPYKKDAAPVPSSDDDDSDIPF